MRCRSWAVLYYPHLFFMIKNKIMTCLFWICPVAHALIAKFSA